MGLSVLASVRICRYFQNSIQGFFLCFPKTFLQTFFDQAENGMFLPDRKKCDLNFIIHTEDRNFHS